MASRRRGFPQSRTPPAADVVWGFYPDGRNPHRVGYLTVIDGVSGGSYTYWVEPRWLSRYCRAVRGWCDPRAGPPDPSPPPHMVVPAGHGAPHEWDESRTARAKVTCWQLTGNGWAVTRQYLLNHPVIEQ